MAATIIKRANGPATERGRIIATARQFYRAAENDGLRRLTTERNYIDLALRDAGHLRMSEGEALA